MISFRVFILQTAKLPDIQDKIGIKFIKRHHKLRTCTKALIITLILAGIVTEPIAVTIHGTDLETDVAKVQAFNSKNHWPW